VDLSSDDDFIAVVADKAVERRDEGVAGAADILEP